jgi:hypothetical protein
VTPAVAALGLPWVTVDLARRSDGVWRVVELGDAQVSDRPTGTTPEALLAALATKPTEQRRGCPSSASLRWSPASQLGDG